MTMGGMEKSHSQGNCWIPLYSSGCDSCLDDLTRLIAVKHWHKQWHFVCFWMPLYHHFWVIILPEGCSALTLLCFKGIENVAFQKAHGPR